MVKLQKDVLDHRINPLKKKMCPSHIHNILSVHDNWEANLQKHRDYTSLKMPSFKNVWVTDLTAETHDTCKLREWVEGEEYFPYKWISEVSSLSSLFLSFLPFWQKDTNTGWGPTLLPPYLHWLWITGSLTELVLNILSTLSCFMFGIDNSSTQFLTSIIHETVLWFLVIDKTQLKDPSSYKTWAAYKINALHIFMSILRTCITITIKPWVRKMY